MLNQESCPQILQTSCTWYFWLSSEKSLPLFLPYTIIKGENAARRDATRSECYFTRDVGLKIFFK